MFGFALFVMPLEVKRTILKADQVESQIRLSRRSVEAGLLHVDWTIVCGCNRPAGCDRPAGSICDKCHTQLHSVWTRCVSKCFVIPVFEVFHCKGWSDMCRTQLHSVWTRCVSKCFAIPVFEVFHCKG